MRLGVVQARHRGRDAAVGDGIRCRRHRRAGGPARAATTGPGDHLGRCRRCRGLGGRLGGRARPAARPSPAPERTRAGSRRQVASAGASTGVVGGRLPVGLLRLLTGRGGRLLVVAVAALGPGRTAASRGRTARARTRGAGARRRLVARLVGLLVGWWSAAGRTAVGVRSRGARPGGRHDARRGDRCGPRS